MMPEPLEISAFNRLMEPSRYPTVRAHNGRALRELGHEVCERLERYGIIVVRDQSIDHTPARELLAMCADYFAQPDNVLMRDARPDLFYQSGVTPPGMEKPLDHSRIITHLQEPHKPATQAHLRRGDPKWRWMQFVGTPPTWETAYPQLNPWGLERVVPQGFENRWHTVMDNHAALVLDVAHRLAALIALGYGLSADTLTKHMQGGANVLGVTCSHFDETSVPGTVQAGWHYDFNTLTVHPPASGNGLLAWNRDWERFEVDVPSGCFLVQAGKELEWYTGGRIRAGFHEVLTPQNVQDVVARARAEGKPRAMRVAAPCFVHIQTDTDMWPHVFPKDGRPSDAALAMYPSIRSGEFSLRELTAIGLVGDATPERVAMCEAQMAAYVHWRAQTG